MSAAASILRSSALSLQVGGRRLLAALDWDVEAGQCWCVIGRNGAGKSTLLRTLAGLRRPDAGKLEIAGRPLEAWPSLELARERAWLPQGRHDAFGYRALDAVLAARHPYQDGRYWESTEDHAAALAALQALDVEQLAERDLRTLSGGERQRVAIAAVVAQDTPLLLLDEPTSALDLAHQVAVLELIRHLCTVERKAVVLVSHDLNLARRIASHGLLLMGDGGWQAGPAAQVMTPALLTDCLGYPVEAIEQGGHTVYVPASLPMRETR
jgi:iron complex transport system ATP-binding protein